MRRGGAWHPARNRLSGVMLLDAKPSVTPGTQN